MFSLYMRKTSIQKYGLCPLCKQKPIDCNFHFVTRRRAIVRWSSKNTIGACKSCNWHENYYSDLSRAWYIREFGVEQYLALVDESKQDFVPTEEYLQGIISKYTQALQDLQNPPKTP